MTVAKPVARAQLSLEAARSLLEVDDAVRTLRCTDPPAWLRLARAVSPAIAVGASFTWHDLPLGVVATLLIAVMLLLLLSAQLLYMAQRQAVLTQAVLALCAAREAAVPPAGRTSPQEAFAR